LILGAILATGPSFVFAETLPNQQPRASGEHVSFNRDGRPIFNKQCLSCHGGVKQLSGLSLIYREQALRPCESGRTPIVPGRASDSYLLERVTDNDVETRMPPADHGPPLSPADVAVLTEWIEQGAKWEEHWAFVPPTRRELPAVNQVSWPRDPLDRFVLARLESAGLAPGAEADRATWLRRASFDLTGLPPTPEAYVAFQNDERADAYERAADRLIGSPHFGERWAAMWLDLARYADTQGFEKDLHRDMWPYRDWVIRAFNDDLTFDRFTIKQLAGDLLPEATLADRVATAFHRNTQTNTEGGTDDEEFRTAAVLDRVSTTWEAWMGSSFRCAQCHDHPYDPIRNKEYYQFVALLNNTRDVDLDDDTPVVKAPIDAAGWPAAERRQRRMAGIRLKVFERANSVAISDGESHSLRADHAACSAPAKLISRDAPDGTPEVLVQGALASFDAFTLEFPLDESIKRLTAIRIEALPQDVQAALRIPEMGFVLTRIKGEIVSEEAAAAQAVMFVAAFADEPHPLMDPEDSLRDNNKGWGDFTRLCRPRHVTFACQQAMPIPPRSKLRLTLQFHAAATGDIGLGIRRGRYSLSENRRWIELVNDPQVRRLRKKLASLAAKEDAIPHVKLPVVEEIPAPFARPTFAFIRGNWLDKGTEQKPGIPKIFARPGPQGVDNRLTMARWIVSPDNPLTARVMVNRIWQELFGVGIVETSEDFGSSGTPPSHPELLDHLALRFEHDDHWSVKRLRRDIVLSAAYRQSAATQPATLTADPRNRLLSRGPRTRLTAEMIRDQALVLSGRLTSTMFGPPVMPPQPDGVWRSVYNGATWNAATDSNRYRRAIYTYWKRTSGYPSMLSFDAPSRDVCLSRRIPTDTPLQALVAMNDEAFIELAQGLGQRMQQAAQDPPHQIAAGFRWATGHDIATPKLERLLDLYHDAGESFDRSPAEAGKLSAKRDTYALTVVANALLNLDEVLTK
jgi:hypothetical protein